MDGSSSVLNSEIYDCGEFQDKPAVNSFSRPLFGCRIVHLYEDRGDDFVEDPSSDVRVRHLSNRTPPPPLCWPATIFGKKLALLRRANGGTWFASEARAILQDPQYRDMDSAAMTPPPAAVRPPSSGRLRRPRLPADRLRLGRQPVEDRAIGDSRIVPDGLVGSEEIEERIRAEFLRQRGFFGSKTERSARCLFYQAGFIQRRLVAMAKTSSAP